MVGDGGRASHPRHQARSVPAFDFDPLLAAAVMVATACTDAIYVLFMNAVVRRKRLPAASWSSVWYLLSSFAIIINYTQNWHYVVFAAAGSFVGANLTVTFINTDQPAPNRRSP